MMESDLVTNTDLNSLRSLLQLKKKYDAPSPEDLPASYKANTDKEKLYLWAVGNFGRQVRQRHPLLRPMCLAMKNECGVEKLVSTFVKPTVLPFAHLFNIDNCASFVSDYILYQALDISNANGKLQVPSSLNSPTFTLATQQGNSLEMSNVLASLLSGFGYQAYVVCGWVEKEIALMDRTKEKCELLEEAETRVRDKGSKTKGKYDIAEPSVLESKFVKLCSDPENPNSVQGFDDLSVLSSAATTKHSSEPGADDDEEGENKKEKVPEYFHAWVCIQISEASFFIETSTGERKALNDPAYLRVNSVWNQNNYWLAKDSAWKDKNNLDLGNNAHWVKFVGDLEAANDKRLLQPLACWVSDLNVPADSYELLYRLGQKAELYDRVRVEYYAPYLLKEGMVQRVQHFKEPFSYEEGKTILPPVKHLSEKFRHRQDKMSRRESYPDANRVIEKFLQGRNDKLREHEYLRLTSNHPIEYISKFYHEARFDGLDVRVFKDLELTEHYQKRMDGLKSMKAVFVVGEKKFGPADSTRGQKDVSKIIETYEEKKIFGEDGEEIKIDLDNPGRVLNTSRIMERVFDVENERILIKFHRERGQIFCKTVEFITPRQQQPDGEEQQVKLSAEDVKVFLVDPREEKPCMRELSLIYREQSKFQSEAIERVEKIEKEMNQLLEDRMKELSANEMEVWLFDVKRNAQVKKGRMEMEKIERAREESVMDLEIDFLGPFMERYAEGETLTKTQVLQIKNDCLSSIKLDLKEKEAALQERLTRLEEDLKQNLPFLLQDDLNSKKFLINIMETRLKRQRKHTLEFYLEAERKVSNDSRLLQYLQ